MRVTRCERCPPPSPCTAPRSLRRRGTSSARCGTRERPWPSPGRRTIRHEAGAPASSGWQLGRRATSPPPSSRSPWRSRASAPTGTSWTRSVERSCSRTSGSPPGGPVTLAGSTTRHSRSPSSTEALSRARPRICTWGRASSTSRRVIATRRLTICRRPPMPMGPSACRRAGTGGSCRGQRSPARKAPSRRRSRSSMPRSPSTTRASSPMCGPSARSARGSGSPAASCTRQPIGRGNEGSPPRTRPGTAASTST